MAWEITEEHKQQMSGFMTDFWKMVKASYEAPSEENKEDHDHYWVTIVKWADALSKKYHGNQMINGIILGYLDGQSNKANGFHVEIDSTRSEVTP